MRNNSKKRNYGKYIRVIGLILFFYILSKINFQELLLIFKNIKPFYFLSALVLLPLSPAVAILKWKTLIDSQKVKISFKQLTEVFLKGFFLGTITPGKLGEFWRAKYLTEVSHISGGRAFYTALMDRLAVLVIVIAAAITGMLNLFLFGKVEIGWLSIVLFSIFAIFIIYFLAKHTKSKEIFKYLLRIFVPFSARKKIDLFFKEFFKGIKELNFIFLIELLGWGFLYYLMTVLVYYLLALSLGINISFFHLFLIVALSWLILLLPVTVLGLGTREATYIFFFSFFSISSSLAVAFSLLILLVGIILSVPGIILIFKK